MFRPVRRFTSVLFTHKENDEELQGAIDAFFYKPGQYTVINRTHCIGNYRITTIRTTYEHPTTRRLLRRRQVGGDEVPTDES